MFTFKQHPYEGRFRSFSPKHWDIKIKKMIVGEIEYGVGVLRIGFMVKTAPTKEHPVEFAWKWVKPTVPVSTIDDIKALLNRQYNLITSTLDLYYMEP